MRYITAAAVLGAAVLSAACDETTPTATDPSLLPVAPTTVEVELPFSEFGSNTQVFTGFGRVSELNTALVANEFDGVLEARALVRFGTYPRTVSVADESGVVVTDTVLTFVGGRVVAIVDTLSAVLDEPPLLLAGALRDEWHPPSAGWTLARDTVGDVLPWSEPGAGNVTFLDSATWDAAVGDTVMFDVDSATVNAWADTADGSRGLRLSSTAAGVRVEFTTVLLNVDIRPSVNPDTVVERTVATDDRTFVYEPPPPPTTGEFRLGGAPSWRTTFRVDLPAFLEGPPELCEAAGCPFQLSAESVNRATLVLRSATSPPGFQPDDTLALDVRTVLSEDDLPKSPIGSSLAGLLGVVAPPELFGDTPEGEISVPITSYIQDRVRGTTPIGDPTPEALVLLSIFEPLSVEIMSFQGPGQEEEPVLRMILTTRVGVPLR